MKEIKKSIYLEDIIKQDKKRQSLLYKKKSFMLNNISMIMTIVGAFVIMFILQECFAKGLINK